MAERPASPLSSMAGRPSLEDLLQDVPSEKLNQPCRDEHLCEIALSITEWQSISPFLGLTEADEVIIQHDYPDSIARKIGMLRKWKKRFGRKATYRKLGQVFWKLKRADLVEELCELLQTESSESSSDEDDLSAARRNTKKGLGSYAKRETKQSRNVKVLESFEPSMTMDRTSSQTKQRNCGESKTQKTGTFQKFRKLFGKKKSGKTKKKRKLLDSDVECAPAANKSTLDSYADYLRGRYSTEIPAFFTLQWPPPPTCKVFNLAMIGHETIQRGPIEEEFVQLTLRGNVDDIMRMKLPIELENLFELDHKEHKVILIEGAPGAGKSTLAWYVCQKWESGGLFQKFKVVIFVQLRDPAIQSATSIADILPVESENMRSELMSQLLSCRGRGVLFVLDGWDEYGPGLRHSSLFQQLICTPGEVNMHFSSLIITSRPIASGELQRYASSRVEIVGFSSAEVKKYFSECIRTSETVQKLQDHLRERPVIEASCYLPLNAAIVVHLFLALNHTLPHTLHEVFLSLVLCCIIRHLMKEAEGGKDVPSISSLDDVPPDVQEPFNNICTMAYHGVMKNKVTFSASDLRSFNLPTELSTLSLIQAVQSFTAFEKSVSYNFLHLSVQELLAALHISKLPAAEQIQVFNALFDRPRLAAVFRFYAAFTKLQTEGVRDIVAHIIQEQQKSLLVNLLHGLYEAQDLSLCQFVASHLKGELDLNRNTLSPMDCIVVGYFLSCVCLTISGEFKVDLRNCSLDYYRVSFLVRELCKCSSLAVSDAQAATGDGCLEMELSGNGLQEKGGKAIGDALMVNRSLRVLDLSKNPISAGVVYLAESLKHNHSLLEINLSDCDISEENSKAIGDALMENKFLQVLDLHHNPISAGVVHIAESLKHNHSLLEINLSDCDISEENSKAIGDALMENKFLQVLDLHHNPISAGVVHIAESLKHNHSLLEINLGKCGITEKCCTAIGDALMVNRSLKVLNLDGNPISAGVVHIAESLKHNHSLIELNLGNCGITEEGFKAICDALMVSRRSLRVQNLQESSVKERRCKAIGDALVIDISLHVLDPCHNPIIASAIHVAESLKHNRSLVEVNLGKCGITEKGAESLGTSLKENDSLQTLILRGNDLSDGGAAHIADGLRYNNCLKKLDISFCNIGDQGMKSVASVLELNCSLEELDVDENNVTGVGLLTLEEGFKGITKVYGRVASHLRQ